VVDGPSGGLGEPRGGACPGACVKGEGGERASGITCLLAECADIASRTACVLEGCADVLDGTACVWDECADVLGGGACVLGAGGSLHIPSASGLGETGDVDGGSERLRVRCDDIVGIGAVAAAQPHPLTPSPRWGEGERRGESRRGHRLGESAGRAPDPSVVEEDDLPSRGRPFTSRNCVGAVVLLPVFVIGCGYP
jgi:hypothetical protein